MNVMKDECWACGFNKSKKKNFFWAKKVYFQLKIQESEMHNNLKIWIVLFKLRVQDSVTEGAFNGHSKRKWKNILLAQNLIFCHCKILYIINISLRKI